ncbi:MAG: cell wall metabolism sensor histidine kinase WalK [Clostridiales bacterium]|nr:cell wall metabolism sensor histidine kinase WalK [Clostridiales bacterium]
MFKSLFSKLVGTYFIIILITIVVLGVLLSGYFEDFIFSRRADELKDDITDLNPYIEMYAMGVLDQWHLYNYFKLADRYKNSTIWIVDDMGYIWLSYASSEEETDKWKEQQLTAEEFAKIMEGESIIKEGKFGERFTVPVLTVGVPFTIRGNIVGAIFMHSPVEEIEETIHETYKSIWLAAAMSAIISVILLFFTSKLISKPLKEMNKITREFAKGNFNRRVNIKSKDEIGQLAFNFNAMADSLNNLEQMRRNFVANVSHELRSPLTTIRGYIQGILDKTISAEKSNKYLSVALDETKRLNKLIDELLDLARIEAGEFPLNIITFELNELIRRVIISQEERITEKDIEVDIDFEREYFYVEGDIDRIQQVLYNLIDNAIKFNPKKGMLSIRTWDFEKTVFVKVKDRGSGIPKEEIRHIWERFYQVDKSRSSEDRGTGLGLSIVKKIVNEHGQDVWINSKLGEGTEFIFSLKLAEGS